MVRVGLLRLLVMWESEAGEIPVIEQNWILFRFFTLMISKMRSVSVMGFITFIQFYIYFFYIPYTLFNIGQKTQP